MRGGASWCCRSSTNSAGSTPIECRIEATDHADAAAHPPPWPTHPLRGAPGFHAGDRPLSRGCAHVNPLRHFIAIGAINGFLAVAFGAFAAHALKDLLSSGLLEAFRTGVHYQAIHALALLVVGLLGDRSTTSKLLRWSGWAFATGILLFSGSLYILALTDIRWLGAITPFGGTAFLLGWALLAWFAMRRRP
ncbi:MAG: DUF423 domain-containing protein [Gammaproteobacteria bacterium]|nr:DUF423 domain-containing protein [Gammaproteobacteria bacterium]